jgi:hypothetical protein
MARELALLIVLAACERTSIPAGSSSTTESTGDRGVGAATKGGPPLAAKEFFRVDGSPAECKVGSTCEAKLTLTALGDYKVNDEYPFKFVADAGELAVEGFAFALDGKKTGVMTVKFKSARAGKAKLTGAFKLSVCNDANCQIEAAKIALDVTAS